MKTIQLDGTWKLFGFPQGSMKAGSPEELETLGLTPIPAQVPGNVELDLVVAGQLADPYTGDRILSLQPLERHEWWYVTEFATPAFHGDVELVFHGSDCIATYWLNGERIGSSDNAFIEHRFEISGRLRSMDSNAANTLVVRLESAVLAAMEYPYAPSMYALAHNWEQLWLRKPAHGFSWDIMPRAVSAGLWRSVELVVHERNEVEDVYLFTQEASESSARIGVYYTLRVEPEKLADLKIRVVGRCGDSVFERTDRAKFVANMLDISVRKPKLWWPRGYGAAHLYEVTVQLLLDGQVLSERSATLGIRKVELVRSEITSAEHPGQFLFKVNDTPILCKGSNWVPADMFHSKDKARIQPMLDLFADLNCNMVRCWGGSVYEDHDFFDRCDREGMMVWQDIALACAFYPQHEAFYKKMEIEVEAIARKLRNHPSLVLWCGDNEIDQFKDRRNIDPNQNALSRRVIADALAKQDPYRPYLPSSPYYSEAFWKHRNDALLPENHLWGPRDYYKSSFYTDNSHHFVSEIGYHGCPNVSSLKRFLDPDALWPWQNNQQWALHSSDPIGLDGQYARRITLMANQMKELFGFVPERIEDFSLASQISQAEAKKFFVERTRIGKWKRTGILWWNMIDGWPQFSDAIVDYYFGKKLAYHYLKRVQQDVCIMLDEPNNWHVRAVIGNDTLQTHEGTYRIWDADTDETLMQGSFRTKSNDNVVLGQIRVSRSDRRLFLIQWTIDGVQYANHYLLGNPPISLEHYKTWLKRIAELEGSFALSD